MSGMVIGRPEAGRAWRALLPWAVAAVVAAALPFLLPGGFALSLL